MALADVVEGAGPDEVGSVGVVCFDPATTVVAVPLVGLWLGPEQGCLVGAQDSGDPALLVGIESTSPEEGEEPPNEVGGRSWGLHDAEARQRPACSRCTKR